MDSHVSYVMRDSKLENNVVFRNSFYLFYIPWTKYNVTV